MKELIEAARVALEFYANGEHEITLTGFKDGKRIDWGAEHRALEVRGFAFRGENYNSTENFVETGQKARNALAAIDAALAAAEQPAEKQGPECWINPEPKHPEDWFSTHPRQGWVRYTPAAPAQPLTDEQIRDMWSWSASREAERTATTQQHAFARAIEHAHGIK